jgi:Tfp pilus assembly protein PilZ
MRLLTVAFSSSAEFLSHYSTAIPEGAVFFPTRTSAETGEPVLLEIHFPGLPSRALMRAAVLSIKNGKGLWLRFHDEERHTRNFLLAMARGDVTPATTAPRSHKRFPVQLPVDCRIAEERGPTTQQRLVSQTLDVGAGGAFVQALSPPPVGTPMELVIGPLPDSGSTFSLQGQVAWVGAQHDAHGFGVRFQDRRLNGARDLRRLLRRASETGKAVFAEQAAPAGRSSTRP